MASASSWDPIPAAQSLYRETGDVGSVESSLLDRLLEQTVRGSVSSPSNNAKDDAKDTDSSETRSQLSKFLHATTIEEKLRWWLGNDELKGFGSALWRDVAARLQKDIALIDQLLTRQLNAIIHHSDFARLEGAWRGIGYLIDCRDRVSEAPIRIRVLNTNWGELRRDFDRSNEFDQSSLFRMVYDDEFGMPGGTPYGAILADFDVHPRPSETHRHDDIQVLKSLAQVAAASFCPIFLNASPSMLGVDRFDQMQNTVDFSKVQADLDFLAWRQFRETEDSRFLGLVMPRILMRKKYDHLQTAKLGFTFDESQIDGNNQLWGGGVFAVGETLIRAFGENRWLADIRGAQRGVMGGGLVLGPTAEYFETDAPEVAPKPITDLIVGDQLERQLSDLGIMSLSSCKGTPLAAFYTCPSTQKPKSYNTPDAQANAKISAMLNYLLCASRFAHYIKIIGRDKIGSFQDAEQLRQELYSWIVDYITPDSEASTRIKSERPLRAAEISVKPDLTKPGSYSCTMSLSPHYELDDLQASIRLVAELAPARI